MQGEPVQIIFFGAKDPSDIVSLTANGVNLSAFIYNNVVQAVYGIDLSHKLGQFPIVATLKDGKTVIASLTVTERKKPTLAFTIPGKLGGTNPVGEQNVATLLTKENGILANLTTNPKKLWTETFRYPTANPVVTDPYGYNRDTGTQTVTHKGTDFRAPQSTPVYAVNRGIARLVYKFSIYGNTVVIDHGQGVFSFYMHMSKTSVTEGTIVAAGQKVGESGGTGYAEGPHLHLTVRLNGTSIDPMKFFELYGGK
ncbi:MAG: M23 family metallopeptidase [Patescibacteria group bacterium]